MRIGVVITAAGSGFRTNLPYNKLLCKKDDMTILEHTLRKFSTNYFFSEIVVTASKRDFDAFKEICSKHTARVVLGGDTRTESVRNGLFSLNKNTDIALIHDGARPNVTHEIIDAAINSAVVFGSGIAAVNTIDTLMTTAGETLNRTQIYQIQTPQAFNYQDILTAYKNADGIFGDDSEVYKRHFNKIHFSAGDSNNYKITTLSDIERFAAYQHNLTGIGYDIHSLESGRKLFLCGVNIPHDKGLLGHSDADVAVHAVMDALLSAIGEKDIGHHFPDTDNEYKNISSMILLENVRKLLEKNGFYVKNVSIAIIAEKPKLSPYIDEMKKSIANALRTDFVGITVTTSERLGLVGKEQAIACYSSVLVTKINGGNN